MDWTIDPLVVPSTLDADDAAGFLALVRIANASWRRDSGTDLHDDDPVELLSRWHEQRYRTHEGLLARRGGAVVGAASLSEDTTTSRSAEVEVVVEADEEHSGVGDALLAALEAVARDRGRSVLQGWTIHRPTAAGDDVLVPPTGAGAIPAADPSTQRMRRAGYALGQVERNSVFDLHGSFDAVDALLADAQERAGSDYRVVWWAGATPAEHADGYARAIARMDTDVPAGELSIEQSTWDAERLAARDRRLEEAGQLLGVTLVVHEPTGEVAAFNELQVGVDRTRPTSQWGTLVMPEHRGRRLGAIVKCVGLQRWREVAPESPCVSTFNAEENRYMLDVNEAVGFRPAAYAAAWEKTLD